MKRLLLPFLLLGLALLPSGISAAKQGASQAASDLQVAVPTHGKPHPHKHPHPDGDNEAEQDMEDSDKQKSEQANIVDSQGLIGDVLPIAANIPVIPVNAQILGNLVVDVIPISLCALIPLTGDDSDDAECELPGGDDQEMSQLRNQEANAGNDTYNQSNENEQEQDSEAEQEAGQVNVETLQSSSRT